MSEPSEDEMERAERIRKLRRGGARSRGHEVRERRRRSRESDDPERGDAEREAATEPNDDSPAEADRADDADSDESSAGTGPLAAGGEVDVLSMAAGLPEDGSLFVVPVREGLRREFNKVAEQLHLRYGFQYERELDAEQHVRPLALYLGVRALEDADVEAVKELLASVDELEAPESEDE